MQLNEKKKSHHRRGQHPSMSIDQRKHPIAMTTCWLIVAHICFQVLTPSSLIVEAQRQKLPSFASLFGAFPKDEASTTVKPASSIRVAQSTAAPTTRKWTTIEPVTGGIEETNINSQSVNSRWRPGDENTDERKNKHTAQPRFHNVPVSELPTPVRHVPVGMKVFLRGIPHVQWNLTDRITFTLVHGSDAQQRNQSEAERFCQHLGRAVATRDKEYVTSHLISLHGPRFTRELMKFVLSHEHRRFWTGGRITKVVKNPGERPHFYLLWSDGTADDFRDLAEPYKDLHDMTPDETRCLYIGYTNGLLSVAKACGHRMNFVCHTRRVDPEAIKVAPKKQRRREHQEAEFFTGIQRRGYANRLPSSVPKP